MNEEYNDLKNTLVNTSTEVVNEKENNHRDIDHILTMLKTYQPINIDISNNYNINNSLDKFKISDIDIRYDINKDLVDYKILVIQNYLQELFVEKKFLDFTQKKENELTENEYLEYIKNPIIKNKYINKWYNDFIKTK